ncbi:MAG: PspC domain-containing protein, partial [Acidimicrobiia bacterium]
LGGGQSATGNDASQAAVVLRRVRKDRVFAGVASGFARYLGVDPVLVRIAWVILTLAGGIEMVLLYIAGAILIPEERPGEITARPSHYSEWGMSRLRLLAGVALVVVGGLMLAGELLPVVFDWRAIGAGAMIVLGALIIFRSRSTG